MATKFICGEIYESQFNVNGRLIITWPSGDITSTFDVEALTPEEQGPLASNGKTAAELTPPRQFYFSHLSIITP